jgi:rSAM-partnered protein
MPADRTRVEDAPRSATGREWEVFVREDAAGPLKHVGSVTAGGPEDAHERATTLFEWTARDMWLCPADETHRFTTHELGGESA